MLQPVCQMFVYTMQYIRIFCCWSNHLSNLFIYSTCLIHATQHPTFYVMYTDIQLIVQLVVLCIHSLIQRHRESLIDACVIQLCSPRHRLLPAAAAAVATLQRWAGRWQLLLLHLRVRVQQSRHSRPSPPAPSLMITSPVSLDHYPLFARV